MCTVVSDRLAKLYRREGMLARAKEMETRLASLEPEYEVRQQVRGWVLVGYDLDEEALETGAKIGISLYWLPVTPVEANGSGWYKAGERLIQVTEVVNLVPNGGFEWSGVGPGYPYGYPAGIYTKIRASRIGSGSCVPPEEYPDGLYSEPVENHAVVLGERNGQLTQYAILYNTSRHCYSSLISFDVPVIPGQFYLLAAWIRTEGGSAWLGYSCGGKRASNRAPTESYVVSSTRVNSWVHQSKLFSAPQGAAHCRLQLLNYRAVGSVFFDDLLFIPIEPATSTITLPD